MSSGIRRDAPVGISRNTIALRWIHSRGSSARWIRVLGNTTELVLDLVKRFIQLLHRLIGVLRSGSIVQGFKYFVQPLGL
jgi:hypothetical protein